MPASDDERFDHEGGQSPRGDGDAAPPARGGIDPEVALPLAIASIAFGLIGLSVPVFSIIATVLGLGSSLGNRRHQMARALAIIGAVMGAVGMLAHWWG